MLASLHPSYDPVMPGSKALEYLGFKHIETLRKLVRLGQIAVIREPGAHSTMRFRLSELNRYLSSREQKAHNEATKADRV